MSNEHAPSLSENLEVITSPETTFEDALEVATEHHERIGGKVEKRTEGLRQLIEHLPANEDREAVTARLNQLTARTLANLQKVLAAGTLGLALNSPALAAQEETTSLASENQAELSTQNQTSPSEYIENIKDLSKTTQDVSGKAIGTVINAAEIVTGLAQGYAKQRLDQTKEQISTLSKEAATPDEKINAAVLLATETPLVSSALEKKVPLLSILGSLNTLRQQLQDPKVSASEVAKELGKTLLNMKTFGFGSTVFSILSERIPSLPEKAPDITTNPSHNGPVTTQPNTRTFEVN